MNKNVMQSNVMKFLPDIVACEDFKTETRFLLKGETRECNRCGKILLPPNETVSLPQSEELTQNRGKISVLPELIYVPCQYNQKSYGVHQCLNSLPTDFGKNTS